VFNYSLKVYSGGQCTDPQRYKLVLKNKSWHSAVNHCHSLHGHLAAIRNADDQADLATYLWHNRRQ